jgi:hypothetical protein
MVEQNIRDPSSGSRYSNKPGNERRAFLITWLILRSASGSGSKILTSNPINKNRATQPPPITPPPTTANCIFLSGAAFNEGLKTVNVVRVWLSLKGRELAVDS